MYLCPYVFSLGKSTRKCFELLQADWFDRIMDRNTTLSNTTEKFSSNVAVLTGYFGFASAVVNWLIFAFMIRLIKRKKSSFVIQLLFVSFSDGWAGMLLFIVSQLQVEDYVSLLACVIAAKLVLVSDCMSKGNILGICIQRYIFARNIRDTTTQWRILHTLTLVIINISFGFSASIGGWPHVEFVESEHQSRICSPFSLNFGTVSDLLTMSISGFIAVTVSGTLCILTIRKLLQPTNIIDVQPQASNTCSVMSQSQSTSCSEGIYMSARKRHHHAIVTILIMLIVFTFSAVPMIVVAPLKVLGYPVTASLLRMCLLAGFVPVVLNPVLIVCRTQDLRRLVKEDVLNCFRPQCKCFCCP